MRKTVAIIDEDAEYGKALAEYINSSGKLFLKAVGMSGISEYKQRKNEMNIRLVLVSEDMAEQLEDDDVVKVLLSEDGLAPKSAESGAVFKYKRADRILNDLLSIYYEEDECRKVVSGDCRIISVYSPVGRSGRTTLSIALGFYYGRNHKTLLISMDEYPGVFRYIGREKDTDLSDVIYAYKKKKLTWNELAKHIYEFEGIDYIHPVRYPEDISQMSTEDMKEFIKTIKNESGYVYIIIDEGSYGRMSMEVLDMSDTIYCPVTEDALSVSKKEEFFETLSGAGRDDTVKKIKEVKVPLRAMSASELGVGEIYKNGSLLEYVKSLIEVGYD